MMAKLTKAHMDVLALADRLAFYGFPAGSNIWPLTTVRVNDNPVAKVDGEIVDELLRAGLLVAKPLAKLVMGKRSPDHDFCPDLDYEHKIVITPAGRAKLAEATR